MLETISFVLGVVGLIVGVAALPGIARRLELRREQRRLESRSLVDAPPPAMSAVDRLCRDRLYYHLDGWARAIRLVGADTDLIPVDRLEVSYKDVPLVLPPELRQLRDQIVQERIATASSDGHIFFDGPNTRLMGWRVSPRDDDRVGREESILYLTLGPVGWYDFEGLNGAFRAHPESRGPEHLYEYYVGLSSLLSDGRVERSKLSNIMDNAVALVTSDGYVGYQRRSRRVSLGVGAFTSTVAENTNRFLDDSLPYNPLSLYNRQGTLGDAPTDYKPKGVPHPVAAVLRGIESEISPDVRAWVDLKSMYVTGISFDLEGLHPSLLFVVLVGLSRRDVLSARRKTPGTEYIEGSLGFVPIQLEQDDTRTLFRQPNWIPSGQASLIRAIEAIQGVARERRVSPLQAITLLRSGMR